MANILKVDMDRILVEIDFYIDKHNKQPNFVIMNEDTAQAISVASKEYNALAETYKKIEKVDGYIHTYAGTPIAISPVLRLGEIRVVGE